jgi:hypothetical protein
MYSYMSPSAEEGDTFEGDMYLYVSPFLAPGGGDTYEYMSPRFPLVWG